MENLTTVRSIYKDNEKNYDNRSSRNTDTEEKMNAKDYKEKGKPESSG